MKIIDCHVHQNGSCDGRKTIKAMDANGIDRTIVLSESERVSLKKTRELLLQTKRLFDEAPDRLTGLAWVNPAIKGMADLAEEALTDMGFAGIKIIPDHWFVYEERFEPFWERLNALKAPILFHTGILYGFEDGSRFCRPTYLEKMCHYPNIRFAMAHISWPWCEECIAIMGNMRYISKLHKRPFQSYIDITPGTPRHIRKQAIANAVDFLGGADHILWGSDDTLPGDLSYQAKVLRSDLAIFDEIGLTAEQKQRILSGTADELFPAKA